MRNELQFIEKIENYLSGRLTGTELSQFEAELAVNQDLRMEVEVQRQLVKRLNYLAAKQDLDLIHSQLYPAKPAWTSHFSNYYALLAGVVLLLVSGIVLFRYLHQAQPAVADFDTDSRLIVRKDTATNNPQIIENKDNNAEKTTESLPKMTDFGNHSSKKFRFTAAKVTDILYPDREQKDKQNFQIRAGRDTVLIGKKGTKIFIPSQVFVRKDGSAVDNTLIKIELIELYDLSDYIKYDLPTISNGKMLESGGVIYLHATENGEKLAIAQGRGLQVRFEGKNAKKERMEAFYLERNEGNANWTTRASDQQEQQRMATLNSLFLEDIENDETDDQNTAQNAKKEKKIKKQINIDAGGWRDDSLDSLIFTKQKERKMIAIPPTVLRYDLYYKGIIEKDLLEKVMKKLGEKKYENTFVSSIPFNERLEGLFMSDTLRLYKGKTQNESEILLQSYLDNVGKPLWIADSLAADLLKSLQEPCKANSPKAAFFRWLAAQRYTTVIQPDSRHHFWKVYPNRYQTQQEFYQIYGIEAGEWKKSYEFLRHKKLFSNAYKRFLRKYAHENKFMKNQKHKVIRDALSARGHWGFVYEANWGKSIQTKVVKSRNSCLKSEEYPLEQSRIDVFMSSSNGSFINNGKNTLFISDLGWINCDRFYDLPTTQRAELFVALENIMQDADYQPTLYAIFKNLNAVMPLIRHSDDKFYLKGLPMDEDIEILALWHDQEKIFYQKQSLSLGKKNNITMHLQSTENQQEVKNMLASVQ